MTGAIQLEPLDLPAQRMLAPYGREVQEAVRRGEHRDVRCFTGPQAWQKARRWRDGHGPGSALLLPPDAAPDSLRWPVVPGGLLVDALAFDRPQAVALARCIGSDGTPLVYAICAGFEAVIVRHSTWRGVRDPARAAA
jgi:hypothetical protein